MAFLGRTFLKEENKAWHVICELLIQGNYILPNPEVEKMKRTMKLLILLPFFLLHGCSDKDSTVDCTGLSIDELEDMVRANCLKIQMAAEEFADQNEGLYPMDAVADTSLVGNTLIDLLPEGQKLVNPFTGAATEPVDSIATDPGETGYSCAPFRDFYIITGYGESSIITEITNVDELNELVKVNCLIVQTAVEVFAALNSGVYPSNVNVDTTPGGDTVIDLLPGGTLLQNPFTKCFSEPIDAAAFNPGETGYVPFVEGSINAGYCITGADKHGNTFVWLVKEP
jgi:hypothetical protein